MSQSVCFNKCVCSELNELSYNISTWYAQHLLKILQYILYFLTSLYIKYNDINNQTVSLPFIIIIFYMFSFYFYNKNKINIATIFHLLFRYVGFLWCCILVHYPYMFLYPLSIIYFTLIFYEWNHINYINNKHVNKFTCNLYYKSGCINLIQIMFMIILLHTFYEYNKHYFIK